MARIYCEGSFYAEDAPVLALNDRAGLLGDGVFETLLWQDGAVRHWADHWTRLLRGLEALGLDAPAPETCLSVIEDLVQEQGASKAVIRLSVTRKTPGRGLFVEPMAPSRVMIAVSPWRAMPPADLVWIDTIARNPKSLSALCKPTSYGDMIAARVTARTQGGTMALIGSLEGHVACADCANVFWVEGDQIYTPSLNTGALPGTTRARILKTAKAQGVMISEVDASPKDLERAQAIYISNALTGLMPVRRFNGRVLAVDCEVSDRFMKCAG